MFKILLTVEFERKLADLDKAEQTIVDKVLLQLESSTGTVEKPLCGLPFFREKKFRNKRLYFLVYADKKTILMVSLSNKKAQQETIDTIRVKLIEYKSFVVQTLSEKTKN